MRAIVLSVLISCIHSFAAFVAVLETVSIDNAISPAECRFLTDELRAQAGVALPAYMNYTIMTRENINVMLPPGKSIEDCEGTCIAETGRNIAADYVAQARVGRFEDRLTLTVELYETGTGNYMGSFTSMQTTAVDLWNAIKSDAKTLFARVQDATRNLGNFGKGQSGWNASPLQKPTEVKPDSKKPKIKKFIKDARDGQEYLVVIIGKRAWMAENLRFNDGKSECYNSSSDNCRVYGRYYTWSQALGIDANCDSKRCTTKNRSIRGVCPEGWHIPTQKEWGALAQYVQRKAGSKVNNVLRSTFAWKGAQGSNESGFNALPSGFRYQNGNFMSLGKTARFWSADEFNEVESIAWELYNEYGTGLEPQNSYKQHELSVRCVSDE